MRPGWRKHIEDSWFRESDHAYAGKDYTKPNSKTFICTGPFVEDEYITGLKTLEAAMDKADVLWPPITEKEVVSKLIRDAKESRRRCGMD